MTTGSLVRIDGLQKLMTELDQLGAKFQKRIINRALTSAARTLVPSIKKATYGPGRRRITGLLQAGVGVRMVKATQRNGVIAAGVFVKQATKARVAKMAATGKMQFRRSAKGSYNLVNKPFYWKFLEFGTNKMTARPYVASVFTAGASKMLDRFRDEVRKGIDKVVAKGG